MSKTLDDFGSEAQAINEGNSSNKRSRASLDAPRSHSACPPPLDDDMEPSTGICQWAVAGSNEYDTTTKTVEKVPPGVYETGFRNNGNVYLTKKDINVDDLMEFDNWIGNSILNEIEDFWSRHSLFRHHGFLHRRGYMFYGPAGGGKTSLVQQIIKRIVDKDGVVFICGHPNLLKEGLHNFREIEPDRNVVCVFEDIDSIIDAHGEDSVLSLLDGESQIDKVLNVATTNYPEKLDKRLVGRPRRFDRVIKIGMPDKNVRRKYFLEKMKLSEGDGIETWTAETEGFSFAAMAELVISVKCLGKSFDDSIETLRQMMDRKPKDFENEGFKVGFSSFQ